MKQVIFLKVVGLIIFFKFHFLSFGSDQYDKIQDFRKDMNLLRARIDRNLDSMDTRIQSLKNNFGKPSSGKLNSSEFDMPEIREAKFILPETVPSSLPNSMLYTRGKSMVYPEPQPSKNMDESKQVQSLPLPVVRKFSGTVF